MFGKFYVLGLGMRRCNPTSLTFRFLCFIKFQIYLADMETLNVADMETVKGYSGKRKGTKHRVHKNDNMIYPLWWSNMIFHNLGVYISKHFQISS